MAITTTKWIRFFLGFLSFSILGLILGGIIFVAVLWKYGADLPDYKQLADYEPPTTTRIHAADGRLIAEYATENRVFVPITSIPKRIIHAFIATEDKNFYAHPGVDLVALSRAMAQNVIRVMQGRRLIGASTITQQVAKNFLLSNDYSFERKIKEAILALRIERALDKDRIMELYLNEIYLGYGSYGIAIASLNYFDKPLSDLTIAQAAYLATLAKAPSNYHPIRKRDNAIARRNWVAARMHEEGFITNSDMKIAQAEDFVVKARTGRDEAEAAYFVEEVRRTLVGKFSSDGFYQGGLSVRTTLDTHLQDIADRSLRWGLMAYDRRHGYRGAFTDISQIDMPTDKTQQTSGGSDAQSGQKQGGITAETMADRVPKLSDSDKMYYLSYVKKPKGAHMFDVALVDGVRDGYVQVMLKDGRRGLVPLQLLEWAREPLKEGYRVGKKIKSANQVVSVGQIILVEPMQAVPDGDKKAQQAYDKMLKNNFGDKAGQKVLADMRIHNMGWRLAQQKMRQSKPKMFIKDGDKSQPSPQPSSEPSAENASITEDNVVEAKAENTEPKPTPEDTLFLELRQVPVVNGGLIAMDPHTGRVLAMAGGWSYNHSEFNRATQAYRQPGSSVKPFVYMTALQNGYTPATLILDAPFVLDIPGQGKWKPSNYSKKFYGPSLMRVGIERSRNAMTVRLAQDVGMDKIGMMLEKFGVAENVEPLLSYSLGAGETTLLRLSTAYSMLVNGGRRVIPTLLDRVQDRNGRNVYRHDARPCNGCFQEEYDGRDAPKIADTAERVVDDATAFQIVKMLEGVVQRGTGRRIRELGIPLAGKTGTTNDLKDTWFMGFSPDLVVGAYVGFDTPKELGITPVGIAETGSTVGAPVFKEFMREALAGKPKIPFRTPSSVRFVRIDTTTGEMATSRTAKKNILLEVFKPGTEPRKGEGRLIVGNASDKSLVTPQGEQNIRKPIGRTTPGLY